MNKNEKIPNSKFEKEISDIELCKKAIEIYEIAKFEFSGGKTSESFLKTVENSVAKNANYLSLGRGLRIGAPGWRDTKLKFYQRPGEQEKSFYIDSNGMDEEEFQKWQKYVNAKFEENGLNFFYFPTINNQESANSQKPEQRNKEYFVVLADKLEQMNSMKEVQHIKYIIDSLRRGNIKEAKAGCFNQSDKFDSIPKIKEVIKKELFEKGEKHPWSLFEK